jgi:hypothetical protein
MSNISKHNIEQFIFDYYEGNLTKEQTNLLMDYLHQNPQFKTLFTTWAMSYAHVEPEPKKYHLESLLIKKSPFDRFKPFALGLLLISASVSIFYLYNKKNEIKPNYYNSRTISTSNIPKGNSKTNIKSKQKTELSLLKFSKKTHHSNLTSDNIKGFKFIQDKYFEDSVSINTTSKTDSQSIDLLVSKQISDSLPNLIVTKTVTPDSVLIIKEMVKTQKTVRKTSIFKKGLRLKPSQKVYPTNQDL